MCELSQGLSLPAFQRYQEKILQLGGISEGEKTIIETFLNENCRNPEKISDQCEFVNAICCDRFFDCQEVEMKNKKKIYNNYSELWHLAFNKCIIYAYELDFEDLMSLRNQCETRKK